MHFGSIAIDGDGRLFYTSTEMKLHVIDWVDADNPKLCSITQPETHTNLYSYKTNDESNDDAVTIIPQVDSITAISISIRLNPSQNKFEISVNGLESKVTLDLKIESIEGKIVFY